MERSSASVSEARASSMAEGAPSAAPVRVQLLSPFLTFGPEEFPIPVQVSEEEAVDKSGFTQA